MKIDISEDAVECIVLAYIKSKIQELKNNSVSDLRVIESLQCIEDYIFGYVYENMGTEPFTSTPNYIEIELTPTPYPYIVYDPKKDTLNNYDYLPSDTEWKDP